MMNRLMQCQLCFSDSNIAQSCEAVLKAKLNCLALDQIWDHIIRRVVKEVSANIN